MVAADSRFDYLSCADGTWGNELHGALIEVKSEEISRSNRAGDFYNFTTLSHSSPTRADHRTMGIIWLFVFRDSGIADGAAPVEAESEVVGVAIGILIAAHVARHILLLLLDGLHIGRHLHGQEG